MAGVSNVREERKVRLPTGTVGTAANASTSSNGNVNLWEGLNYEQVLYEIGLHNSLKDDPLFFKLVSKRELQMTMIMDQMGVCPKLVCYHPVRFNAGEVDEKRFKSNELFVIEMDRYPVAVDTYVRRRHFFYGVQSTTNAPGTPGGQNPIVDRCRQLLATIHAAGFVHFDAFPRNFVCHPETGEVKMIDFQSTMHESDVQSIKMDDCIPGLDPSGELTYESIRMDDRWRNVLKLDPDATFFEYDNACFNTSLP